MFKNKIETENKIYDLNYSVSKTDDEGFVLYIAKEYNGNIVDVSMVKLAPLTFESLVEIAEVMCRNAVTPTSFCEIAENMIVDKIFVE